MYTLRCRPMLLFGGKKELCLTYATGGGGLLYIFIAYYLQTRRGRPVACKNAYAFNAPPPLHK